MITLLCIVLAAILFPGHPYIESATVLSDEGCQNIVTWMRQCYDNLVNALTLTGDVVMS